MATTIRELLVRLGVDADTKKVAEFDRALGSAKTGLFKITAAAALAAGALAGFAVSTAMAGDEAAKASKRIGINVEEMQELGHAAQLAGADMGSIEVAFRRQAVAARDAEKSALSPSALAYDKIGVSVRDASGAMKGQLQLFEESADGLRKLKTATERMAVANDLFGRGGSRILPLLNEGSEGIRKMRQQARDLGVVMDAKATAASERFIDAMTETKAVLTGLRNQIGIALIPIFTRFTDRVRDWFLANGQIIKQKIDGVVDKITDSVRFLEKQFKKLNERVEDAGGWFVILDQVRKVMLALTVAFGISRVIKFFGIVKALTVGLVAMGAALTGPVFVGLFALTGFLLSALIIGEDFLVFLRDGESSIGDFLAAFGLEKEAREAMLKELASLKRLALAAVGAFWLLVDVFGPTDKEMAKINEGLAEFGKWVDGLIKTGLEAMIQNIKDVARTLGIMAVALESPKAILRDILDTMDDILNRADKLKNSRIGGLLTAGGAPGGDALSSLGRGIVARGRRGLKNLGPSTGALALAGGGGGGGSTTNNTVGGSNITINAGAADAKEVAAEVAKVEGNALRKALAAAQGGER